MTKNNVSAEKKRKQVDWEGVERDYRAGVLSLREIGKLFDITEGAIRKKAKAESWVRDLAAKIQARADDLVRKAAVREEVRSTQKSAERAVIEANADRIAAVRNEHRQDIGQARRIVGKLMTSLEAAVDDPALFAELGDMMRAPDEFGRDKLNDLYRKIVDLPSHIEGVKKLSEALSKLVALEREAYGLSVAGDGPRNPADPGAMTVDQFRAVAQELVGKV